MRRGILGVLDCTIATVVKVPCRLRSLLVRPGIRDFRRRACGRKIKGVDRIGKRVVLRLEGGDAIVFEPRMSGLVLVGEAPDLEHLRFRITLEEGPIPELLFWDRRGLGSVQLMSQRQLRARLGGAVLGPDALVISADDLRARLGSGRRAIKVALLDQRAVAGIGNIYASEILHEAGIDPRCRCQRLTRLQWQRLHAAMQNVLCQAIRHEGSTLGDGTYRTALNNPGEYQNQHRVYDRAGRTCDTCRQASILRIIQAQRSTFYCPLCQPARRPSRSSISLP